MKRLIAICALFLIVPVVLFSQDDKPKKIEEKKGTESKSAIDAFPPYSIHSKRFKLRNVTFNKSTDVAGRGEILRVEMEIINQLNDPMDFYIFVVATHEKQMPKSSHAKIIHPDELVRNFTPFPNDHKNFEYTEEVSSSGDTKKSTKTIFRKFPRDPKLGIDPATKKPYHLTDRLHVITSHFNPFVLNYVFYNKVTILIYNEKDVSAKSGSVVLPIYRQDYYLRGINRGGAYKRRQ